MAAKKVASVLHILTSNGISDFEEWPDAKAFEVFVLIISLEVIMTALKNLIMMTLVSLFIKINHDNGSQ